MACQIDLFTAIDVACLRRYPFGSRLFGFSDLNCKSFIHCGDYFIGRKHNYGQVHIKFE